MSGPPGEYQTTTFMEYKNLIKKDDHFEMLTQAFKEENALQAQRVKDGTAAKARDYLAKMDPKVRTNLCRVQPVLSPRGGAPPLPVA